MTAPYRRGESTTFRSIICVPLAVWAIHVGIQFAGASPEGKSTRAKAEIWEFWPGRYLQSSVRPAGTPKPPPKYDMTALKLHGAKEPFVQCACRKFHPLQRNSEDRRDVAPVAYNMATEFQIAEDSAQYFDYEAYPWPDEQPYWAYFPPLPLGMFPPNKAILSKTEVYAINFNRRFFKTDIDYVPFATAMELLALRPGVFQSKLLAPTAMRQWTQVACLMATRLHFQLWLAQLQKMSALLWEGTATVATALPIIAYTMERISSTSLGDSWDSKCDRTSCDERVTLSVLRHLDSPTTCGSCKSALQTQLIPLTYNVDLTAYEKFFVSALLGWRPEQAVLTDIKNGGPPTSLAVAVALLTDKLEKSLDKPFMIELRKNAQTAAAGVLGERRLEIVWTVKKSFQLRFLFHILIQEALAPSRSSEQMQLRVNLARIIHDPLFSRFDFYVQPIRPAQSTRASTSATPSSRTRNLAR